MLSYLRIMTCLFSKYLFILSSCLLVCFVAGLQAEAEAKERMKAKRRPLDGQDLDGKPMPDDMPKFFQDKQVIRVSRHDADKSRGSGCHGDDSL
jgi:hypothetical protein